MKRLFARLHQLDPRDAMAIADGRYRVRDRTLLRYYARSIAHLIAPVRDTSAPVA